MTEYEPIIQEAAKQYGIDPELIRRMIRQESAGRPNALSNKGASGLMQLMPDTARELGVKNILDPKENILAGTQYMRKMLDKYGDTERALAAYNAGPGNVDKHGGIPPFRETQDYVSRILKDYQAPGQVQNFPSGTPTPAPMANPVAQALPSQQTGPVGNRFKVTDPKTGKQYIMSGEGEPTDEEIETYIAQFEQENPQVPEHESNPWLHSDPNPVPGTPGDFKAAVLEGGTAAKFIKNPMQFVKGIGEAIKDSYGFAPLLGYNMLKGELENSYNRANTELDRVGQIDKGDEITRWANVLGAGAAAIPVFGELVKPMRESIPQNPQIPIDVPRAAGNALGKTVDAVLSRFAPPVAEAGIGTAGRGLSATGRAISQNATNRLATNAKLGPVTASELANDVLPWRSGRSALALGTSYLSPPVGAAIGGGLAAAEAVKLAKRSDSLARLQGRLGRAINPSAEDLFQGPMPEFPPNIPPVEDLWKAAEEINPALVRDPVYGKVEDVQTDVYDFDPNAIDPVELHGDPTIIPSVETQWAKALNPDKPIGTQDLSTAIDPNLLEPKPLPPLEDLWAGQTDKPVGMQSLDDPWDATQGAKNPPAVSVVPPAERTLPEIKGKEGKRIYGEDQNRVSKNSKLQAGDEDTLSLDPEDNIDISLDEPEIVSRRGKLVDTTKPPEKKVVEIKDEVIPFADIESGSRVKTANGKEGTVQTFDDKSVTVKWDSGTTSRIARKDAKKVEVKKASPKDELEDIDLSSLDEPSRKPNSMRGILDSTIHSGNEQLQKLADQMDAVEIDSPEWNKLQEQWKEATSNLEEVFPVDELRKTGKPVYERSEAAFDLEDIDLSSLDKEPVSKYKPDPIDETPATFIKNWTADPRSLESTVTQHAAEELGWGKAFDTELDSGGVARKGTPEQRIAAKKALQQAYKDTQDEFARTHVKDSIDIGNGRRGIRLYRAGESGGNLESWTSDKKFAKEWAEDFGTKVQEQIVPLDEIVAWHGSRNWGDNFVHESEWIRSRGASQKIKPEPSIDDIGDVDLSGLEDEVPKFKKFKELADAQRGEPESAMLKVQFAAGGGVIHPVIEHVGDLIHRMTEKPNFGNNFGRKIILDKIDTALNRLEHEYGFDKEFKENLENNAKYNKADPIEYSTKVDAALKEYRDAHAKLSTYNKPQQLAKEAAIAVGDKNWQLATQKLKELRELAKDEIIWKKEASNFKPEASIDDIGDIDPFGVEPKRKASGAVKKVESQYPKAKAGLKTYKVSGKPTPRSNLTNDRIIGDSPRQLGLNDRAIQASKVGWNLKDTNIRKALSEGTATIQVNIDELIEAAKEDIARPGRAKQKVGNTDKLERAKNFLATKNKSEPVNIPEIEIKNGKVVIADGYHRAAAARHLGELSLPVRIPLSQIGQLTALGVKHRKLY